MELRVLKYGNLMGTPDAKEILLRAGPGSELAHARWLEMARIKTAFGYNGQCTSVLLVDEEPSDAFPALVDPSFLTATGDAAAAVTTALTMIRDAGVKPDAIKTVLVTHAHADHFDPRLLAELPQAQAYCHPQAPIDGCKDFDPDRFAGKITALNTPGHGGPHSSYLLELAEFDLSICLAGDLIMSHAHYLARQHPLSFTQPEQGLASIEAVRKAMLQRGRQYNMVFPGHDLPFFLLDE